MEYNLRDRTIRSENTLPSNTNIAKEEVESLKESVSDSERSLKNKYRRFGEHINSNGVPEAVIEICEDIFKADNLANLMGLRMWK